MLGCSPQCSVSAQIWDATAAVPNRNMQQTAWEFYPDRAVPEPLQRKGLKVYNTIFMTQLHVHQTQEQFWVWGFFSSVVVHMLSSVQAITGEIASLGEKERKKWLQPKSNQGTEKRSRE